MRRTTTVDILHPYGPGGDLVLEGRGQDVVTGAYARGTQATRGIGTVIDTAAVRVRLRYTTDRVVTEISAQPELPEAAAATLVGVRASGGFRKVLDQTMPDSAGSLTYQLLDEVPVTALIAGAGLTIVDAPRPARDDRVAFLDGCAGWVSTGSMAVKLMAGEMSWDPGPPAPSLDVAGDPLAWHEMGPLEPGCMRRRRRMDVLPATADRPVIVVDAMFRDTAMNSDGVEVVIHEYSLGLEIDPETDIVLSVDVVPRVLPGPECPSAAASAGRVVGQPVGGLRGFVRAHFGGVSTCTHLNDQLRALADVATLLPHARAR